MTTITHIGKYEVRREIGRGGMGVVYEGFDPDVQRQVAIKTLHPHLIDEDNVSELERFRREAQAAAACIHPNIVHILEFGQSHGTPYIAMDFVEGDSLEIAMRERSDFGLRQVLKVFSQMLSALRAAHRLGIVHRDIKPGNVLVDQQWFTRLTDFGIARVENSSLTKAGVIVGTPLYMPPEQSMALQLDHRADLFSATVVLHEMLANARIHRSIPCKPLEPIPGLPPSLRLDPSAPIPIALHPVLRRGLSPDRNLRHRDAEQLAREIKQALVEIRKDHRPDTLPTSQPQADTVIQAPQVAATDENVSIISSAMSDTGNTTLNSGLASALDETFLSELKESLARYVRGNVTELVDRHAENAISVAELVHLLAEEIPKPRLRKKFLDQWSS
ncbi:MAG: serine/threonine-protein kinase [Pseudomonadota bacterium]